MGKILFVTSCALICFAANSVLSRLALGDDEIDASSFTLIRLLSGAVTLLILSMLRHRYVTANKLLTNQNNERGNWLSAFLLFQYAICFSFAYTQLSAASGAIILFATVQITMILSTLIKGSRLHKLEWIGMGIAIIGFIYLLSPGFSAPSPRGFLLMVISGIGWGGYTLRGRRSIDPLADTTWNFVRSLPMLLLVLPLFWQQQHGNSHGVLLAIASGSVASGIGYAVWYQALTYLTTTQAAVVQLMVPVLTAIAGIVLISEAITLRLLIASTLILGGILLVILKTYYVKGS